MTINIRPIKPEDNQAIQKIIQTILEKHALDLPGTAYFDPQLGKLFEYYKEIPNGAYWVLTENEQIIGGVGIGPFGDYEDIAELQKYYIIENKQGKGYGTLLYEQALSFAKQEGFSHLYLETIDRLDAANEIYKHLGFKQLEKPLEGSEHGLMNRWFILELK